MDDASDRTLEELEKNFLLQERELDKLNQVLLKKLKHPKVGKNLKNYVES